jgi:eukaryotic-like serine/threonine-protein kinase
MDPGRLQQIQDLYHSACERAPGERKAFLAHACRGDEQLQREVESLVAQNGSSEGAMQRPAISLLAKAVVAEVSVGTTLGPYEIESLLGAGGMGQVYKARDTRLGRTVAIKIANQRFDDRFDREARAIASLNHPNICTLFDIGPNYMVMELVTGPTLAERIQQGPVPLEEALGIAKQIAVALEAAHEKGVVHRDLKPANIKIAPKGVVKVLDFGLAKVVENEPSESPTVLESTQAGIIMGTAAYMSPEQASGKRVDRSADVWSFGVVLWEMLTGRRLFEAETVSHTLANVLLAPIDFSRLPQDTPAPIRDLLRRCLDRDPSSRLRDVGEARVIIQAPRQPLPEIAPRRRLAWIWAAGGVMALLGVVAAARFFYSGAGKPVPAEQWKQITNFSDGATSPALSRDGRMLAFTRGSGWYLVKNELYVKLMPDGPAVPYTSDGIAKMVPQFSPDGSRIAYTVGGRGRGFSIWTVPVLGGGQPQLMLSKAEGLTWIDAHRILFSEDKPEGMGVETALENRASQREIYIPKGGMAHFSALSPDGKQVLVVEMAGVAPWLPCRLLPFDGSSRGRQVGPAPAQCTAAAWSPDGKWMYFTASQGQGSHIWRQRVNEDKPEQITFGPAQEQGLAMAPDGRSLFTSVGTEHRGVWLHDSNGERQISGEGSPGTPFFSPDGMRVYYMVAAGKSLNLWVTDLKTGRSELALPATAPLIFFTLSPDGKSVLYVTSDHHAWTVPLDSPSPPRAIPLEDATISPGDLGDHQAVHWAASGRLYFPAQEGGKPYYFSMKLDGSDRRKALSEPADWRWAQVSPDERWVTHKGVASPLAGGSLQHVCDCQEVRWSVDGKLALFWFRGGQRTVAVPLKAGEMFPPLPPGGFETAAELAKLPGAIVIPADFADVGPGMSSWAYHRANNQQNIFQIPLQ